VGINSPSHRNFKTPDRVPAQRYVILFATKGANGKPTSLPDDLVRQARMINGPGSETADTLREPRQVERAPWEDGEVQRLALKMKTGATVGMIVYTARLVQTEGKPAGEAWRIESYMVLPAAGTRQFTSVDATRDTFAPITGRTKNALGDFRAKYQADKVTLEMSGKDNKSVQDVAINGAVYDNEQVLYLIRRLPLAAGYSTAFQIFTVQGGTTVECRIKVSGKEKALERECYKVALECWMAGAKQLEHQLWFSADSHRYLVKYDSGTAVMELAGTGSLAKGQEAITVSGGARVTLPSGWFGYLDEAPGKYKAMLRIIVPELAAEATLIANAVPEGMDSPRKIAEADTEVVKKYLQDYTVRGDSWTEAKVAGLPAASYTADYKQDGKEMVEHRTYLVDEPMVYWFVFRVEKGAFKGLKPQFDSVVGSLRRSPAKDASAAKGAEKK